MMMLMLEVAGTQGSQCCFAFAGCCCRAPSSLATGGEDGHDDGEWLNRDNADMQKSSTRLSYDDFLS